MKIGLALSGGGAKGIAHAGVIKAIQERNISIHSVTGTSAGAIVGALYAAGTDIDRIYEFFANSNLFDPRKYAFRKAGFLNSEGFTTYLDKFLPNNTFESLEKPLKVTATNINSMQLKIFDHGELFHPILASAAFPGIFTPVVYQEETYIDGGVLNNFPIDLLSDCDLRIGSYVGKVEHFKNKRLKRSIDIAGRAYDISQYARDAAKFHLSDIMIEPDGLYHYGIFSFKSLRNMFDLGYNAAAKAIDESAYFK